MQDVRSAEEACNHINAWIERTGYSLPLGGGAMAQADEVRVRGTELQARTPKVWYWLTDGQVESMVRRAV